MIFTGGRVGGCNAWRRRWRRPFMQTGVIGSEAPEPPTQTRCGALISKILELPPVLHLRCQASSDNATARCPSLGLGGKRGFDLNDQVVEVELGGYGVRPTPNLFQHTGRVAVRHREFPVLRRPQPADAH